MILSNVKRNKIISVASSNPHTKRKNKNTAEVTGTERGIFCMSFIFFLQPNRRRNKMFLTIQQACGDHWLQQ